mgnify:CR=1 FL=1
MSVDFPLRLFVWRLFDLPHSELGAVAFTGGRSDKHKAKKSYMVVGREAMKKQLQENGSLTAAFTVGLLHPPTEPPIEPVSWLPPPSEASTLATRVGVLGVFVFAF